MIQWWNFIQDYIWVGREARNNERNDILIGSNFRA